MNLLKRTQSNLLLQMLAIFIVVTYSTVSFAAQLPSKKVSPVSQNNEYKKRKRSKRTYIYFTQIITSFPEHDPSSTYDKYIDPNIPLPKDTDASFLEKILALNYLERSTRELKAMHDLNEFLSTNFKTEFLPGKVYVNGNSNIPRPLYLNQLSKLSFDAIDHGDLYALKALIDNFHLINHRDGKGYSLLSYAILHNKNDIARTVLYKGAYINDQNNYGATPLSVAVRNNNNYMASLLLVRGAKLDIKDKFGKTAYDYAVMNKNTKIAKEIAKYSPKYKRVSYSKSNSKKRAFAG